MAEKQNDEQNKDAKKIIIDEEWKQQAKKEKEILTAQEKTERKETEQRKPRSGPLPPANFIGLVSMLATQTFFALGLLTDEQTKEKKEPDLELAKYHIDMLASLQEKTKGNLTEEEEKMLSGALHQLRMSYVKLTE